LVNDTARDIPTGWYVVKRKNADRSVSVTSVTAGKGCGKLFGTAARVGLEKRYLSVIGPRMPAP